MTLEGNTLPLLPEARYIDVWKMKHPKYGDGIAFTISNDDGHIFAGVHLTAEQWKELIDAVNSGG